MAALVRSALAEVCTVLVLLVSCETESINETIYSHASAETRACFDGCSAESYTTELDASSLLTSLISSLICCATSCSSVELHDVVSETAVGCASTCNDSKMNGRQMTASTKTVDMFSAL